MILPQHLSSSMAASGWIRLERNGERDDLANGEGTLPICVLPAAAGGGGGDHAAAVRRARHTPGRENRIASTCSSANKSVDG